MLLPAWPVAQMASSSVQDSEEKAASPQALLPRSQALTLE